jgi:hypothetical protein
MERAINHGFLPASIDKNPLGISNFGISSIILFFLAIGLDVRNKNSSNVTRTLIIVGGAIIGTTALGVSMMDKSGGWIVTFLTISVIGYVIMGLGILRAFSVASHKHERTSIKYRRKMPFLFFEVRALTYACREFLVGNYQLKYV